MSDLRYELRPVKIDTSNKINGVIPITKRRNLLGSSESCDLILSYPEISGIHAVIEVSPEGIKVFDMNSKNGSYIGDKKIVVEHLKVGDVVTFADKEYELANYNEKDLLPPKLDMLKGRPNISHLNDEKNVSGKLSSPGNSLVQIPTVEYPLAKDPKAEFSEYIFEDSDNLYPIFKYEYDKESIEVIIMYKDRIYSVDYVPVVNGTIKLVGSGPRGRDLEYVYLRRKEKIPFIYIKERVIEISKIDGFNLVKIAENGDIPALSSVINLEYDEILCFSKDDLQLFVRRGEAPPEVKVAPVLRRDRELHKYLFFIFLFISLFLTSMAVFDVDEEKKKEKAPERAATILYKKPAATKAIAKTRKRPKKIVQKAPKKKEQLVKKVNKVSQSEKKNQKNKKSNTKTGIKNIKKVGKVKKATPKKANVTKKTPLVRNIGKNKSAKSIKRSTKSSRRAQVSKSLGRVDTYKSVDFKSTLSSLMSKGGNTKAVKANTNSQEDIGELTITDAGESATLKNAKVSKDVGSLSGVASGKLKAARGVPGLVNKKSIYTAGLPDTVVVMGGMDPDSIRRVILDHIPQFRYCYQKVLDRSSREFNGRVKLNFVIGASGHVTRAGIVESSDALPATVSSCVVNVLKGLPFPEPPGGAKVEVVQPFNFMPNMN